mgnify:CR=1 FL=1
MLPGAVVLIVAILPLGGGECFRGDTSLTTSDALGKVVDLTQGYNNDHYMNSIQCFLSKLHDT